MLAAAIAKENNIIFLDYSADPYYTSHSEYFADFRHLNKEGAGVFSKQVAQKILQSSIH
jgi:hypothetical protein